MSEPTPRAAPGSRSAAGQGPSDPSARSRGRRSPPGRTRSRRSPRSRTSRRRTPRPGRCRSRGGSRRRAAPRVPTCTWPSIVVRIGRPSRSVFGAGPESSAIGTAMRSRSSPRASRMIAVLAAVTSVRSSPRIAGSDATRRGGGSSSSEGGGGSSSSEGGGGGARARAGRATTGRAARRDRLRTGRRGARRGASRPRRSRRPRAGGSRPVPAGPPADLVRDPAAARAPPRTSRCDCRGRHRCEATRPHPSAATRSWRRTPGRRRGLEAGRCRDQAAVVERARSRPGARDEPASFAACNLAAVAHHGGARPMTANGEPDNGIPCHIVYPGDETACGASDARGRTRGAPIGSTRSCTGRRGSPVRAAAPTRCASVASRRTAARRWSHLRGPDPAASRYERIAGRTAPPRSRFAAMRRIAAIAFRPPSAQRPPRRTGRRSGPLSLGSALSSVGSA